jgi:hypothetical protein
MPQKDFSFLQAWIGEMLPIDMGDDESGQNKKYIDS